INNSANVPSYVVNLTCTGTGPELVATPSTLAFGTLLEGSTKSLPLTLSNSGEATVTISPATITPNNVGYTITGVPAMLAAGTSVGVTVTFAPTMGVDGGPATLAIASDAASSPATVALTGTGQPFGITVTCPDCTTTPPITMNYGDVRWDSTTAGPPAKEMFTLKNVSDASATGTPIRLASPPHLHLTSSPAT